jgi:hypothetical protein
MKKTLTLLLVLVGILGYSQSNPDTLTYGTKNLKIVSVSPAEKTIAISGSVPGAAKKIVKRTTKTAVTKKKISAWINVAIVLILKF